MFFQDLFLNELTCMDPFREIVILQQLNAKSVMDTSIWVNFISKNSNTLEIEHSLLYSPIIILRYGFHFRSTDRAYKPHS